jgi:DNA-binding transcriptional regulator PaaX
MSLPRDILNFLLETELNYKGMRVNLLGMPSFKDYSRETVRTTINRLHRNDLLEKDNTYLALTKKGREYIEFKASQLKQFKRIKNHDKVKNLLVFFDIPESKRICRDWLRRQLIELDFYMIQKSVWVGPSPLPQEFIDYIKELGIEKCLKTFKLAKGYKVGKL